MKRLRHSTVLFCSVVGVVLVAMIFFCCSGGSGNIEAEDYEINYANLMLFKYATMTPAWSQGEIGILNAGEEVRESSIEAHVENSSGEVIVPDDIDYEFDRFLYIDCSAGTCTEATVATDSRLLLKFYPDLTMDTYQIQIDMQNGQRLTTTCEYPEPIELPYIHGQSMSYHWGEDNLVLNWTNPQGDPNWDEVDQLIIILEDEAGHEVLRAQVARDAESVSIPESVVNQAVALYDSYLFAWRILANANDANNMVFAQSESNHVSIEAP